MKKEAIGNKEIMSILLPALGGAAAGGIGGYLSEDEEESKLENATKWSGLLGGAGLGLGTADTLTNNVVSDALKASIKNSFPSLTSRNKINKLKELAAQETVGEANPINSTLRYVNNVLSNWKNIGGERHNWADGADSIAGNIFSPLTIASAAGGGALDHFKVTKFRKNLEDALKKGKGVTGTDKVEAIVNAASSPGALDRSAFSRPWSQGQSRKWLRSLENLFSGGSRQALVQELAKVNPSMSRNNLDTLFSSIPELKETSRSLANEVSSTAKAGTNYLPIREGAQSARLKGAVRGGALGTAASVAGSALIDQILRVIGPPVEDVRRSVDIDAARKILKDQGIDLPKR